ncbi:hypothetical protein GC177_05925 [bacterium]|nr:hypothetical protein [bacterium]
MADIQTLSRDEVNDLVADEHRFEQFGISAFKRDMGASILEGAARSFANFAVFWGVPVLGPYASVTASAATAYADDVLRTDARAELVKLTVDKLNAKNGLAVSFSEDEARGIAEQYRRSPTNAVVIGGAKAFADATFILGAFNAVGQEAYNANEVSKERQTIHTTERLYMDKVAQEEAVANMKPAVAL